MCEPAKLVLTWSLFLLMKHSVKCRIESKPDFWQDERDSVCRWFWFVCRWFFRGIPHPHLLGEPLPGAVSQQSQTPMKREPERGDGSLEGNTRILAGILIDDGLNCRFEVWDYRRLTPYEVFDAWRSWHLKRDRRRRTQGRTVRVNSTIGRRPSAP
jgi:hypothetical protein